MKPKRYRFYWQLLLVIIMIFSLLPVNLVSVLATGTPEKNITLGASALKGGQQSNVYFGRYQQSSLGNTEPTEGAEGIDWITSSTATNNGQGAYYSKDPIKWRVLSNANGKAFLLSYKNLDLLSYHEDYEAVTWETSTMRSWLNGYGATANQNSVDYSSTNTAGNDNFIDYAFSASEKTHIADTTVVNDDNPTYNTDGGNDTTDKVFLLSIAEAENTGYGFIDSTDTRKSVNTAFVYGGGHTGASNAHGVGEAGTWWLRSSGRYSNCAVMVGENGRIYVAGDRVYYNNYAVRPAFNLNLSAVLFTSAAKGGKSSTAAVGDGAAILKNADLSTLTDNDGHKLTLKDSSRTFSVSDTSAKTVSRSDMLSIAYSNAKTGTNEYISAMITDGTGEVIYYGQLAQLTTGSGTADFVVPSDIAAGTYTLKLFNEQVNGDYKTDYASDFVDIELTVNEAPMVITVSVPTANTGLTYDGTEKTGVNTGEGYTLTGNTATNAGDYTATATLESGYKWSDDTTEAKSINWSIAKATPTLTQPTPEAVPYGTKLSDITLGEGWAWDDGDTVPTVTNSGYTAKYTVTDYVNYDWSSIEGYDADTHTVTRTIAVTVEAPEKNITLGSSALKGGQQSNVYFGRYQQSGLGNTEPTEGAEGIDWIKSDTATQNGQGAYYSKDSIKWRVLSNANGKAFLLSDKNLDVVQYQKGPETATWETSTIRSWLNGYGADKNTGDESGIDYSSENTAGNDNFIDYAFSASEKAHIADTTVVNDDNPTYNTEGGNDTTDKVFLLSIAEAKNTGYGFTDTTDSTDTRKSVNTAFVYGGGHTGKRIKQAVGEADYWWLRSIGYDSTRAGAVGDDGMIFEYGYGINSNQRAVRPAFNLNLSSVLFTSAAKGGKSSTADAGGGAAILKNADFDSISDNDGHKLTLKDSSRTFSVSDTSAKTVSRSDMLSIAYSNAKTGTNEYISAMITDGTGEVIYYGQLAQPETGSGTADFVVPSDIAAGTYTLKLFNEQVNGDYKTDYASDFVDIELTVTEAPVPDYELLNIDNSGLIFSDNKLSGDVTVIVNNNTASEKSAIILLALYNSTGRMAETKLVKQTLNKGSNKVKLEAITFDGVQAGSYTLKCFVWDALESMKPLADTIDKAFSL